MIQRKVLVLGATALAFVTLGTFGLASYLWRKPPAVQIEMTRFPTLGDPVAKVELIFFEDLCCPGCKEFDEKIFPIIVSRYIDTGKVLYTAVPLAFLKYSKIRGNAAWAVYKQNPTLFFPFVHELFLQSPYGEISRQTLLDIAQKVGGIDLIRLDACIQSNCYYAALESNMEWAKTIMTSNFGTPALYVNGVRTSVRSFEAIEKQIERMLTLP